MNFCSKCRKSIKEDVIFCGSCGTQSNETDKHLMYKQHQLQLVKKKRVILIAVAILTIVGIAFAFFMCNTSNPSTIINHPLVGVWERDFGNVIAQIVLNGDGTVIFIDINSDTGETQESPPSWWHIEGEYLIYFSDEEFNREFSRVHFVLHEDILYLASDQWGWNRVR